MKNILFVAILLVLAQLAVADNEFTTNLNMNAHTITNVSTVFTSNITAYCYKDAKGNVITDFGVLTANIYPTLISNIAKGLDLQLSNWMAAAIIDLVEYIDVGVDGSSNYVYQVAAGTADFMRIQSLQATENVAITNSEGSTITTLIFTNGVYLGHQ
jgi:hypothetical protein